MPQEAVSDLAGRLRRVWSRFRDCFKTATRDTRENAWVYLGGLLTLATKRNYSNIVRRVVGVYEDGQSLQQFMSDSPWAGENVFRQIQREIPQRPGLAGGMSTLDESGDACAGEHKAGAARQYLGREGKVDLGQVGGLVGYSQNAVWAMVGAELYLPEVWFAPAQAKLRQRWHIPAECTFATKPQLGLALIRQARANGLEFAVVGMASLYGRDGQLRADRDAEHFVYMADIPADTCVYLQPPVVGIPETPVGKKGRPFSQPQVLNDVAPVAVRTLVGHPDFALRPLAIRHTERGLLTYACAAHRVWTLTPAAEVREEWLFLRKETDDTFSFSLSNAALDVPLHTLALWRCQRDFIERTFQDAKAEGGWDEWVARKYRAWMHHTALDALALWFVAETKLEWAQAHPRDSQLAQALKIAVLPALSMSNVRELLRTVMPLNQLSPDEATRLVIKHLVNRSNSR